MGLLSASGDDDDADMLSVWARKERDYKDVLVNDLMAQAVLGESASSSQQAPTQPAPSSGQQGQFMITSGADNSGAAKAIQDQVNPSNASATDSTIVAAGSSEMVTYPGQRGHAGTQSSSTEIQASTTRFQGSVSGVAHQVADNDMNAPALSITN